MRGISWRGKLYIDTWTYLFDTISLRQSRLRLIFPRRLTRLRPNIDVTVTTPRRQGKSHTRPDFRIPTERGPTLTLSSARLLSVFDREVERELGSPAGRRRRRRHERRTLRSRDFAGPVGNHSRGAIDLPGLRLGR